MKASEKTRKETKKGVDEVSWNEKSLILYNDDIHSFDYVINALVEICRHDYTQAAQCTVITHYKGKCDVKKGSYEKLKPMNEALVDRELSATID